MKQSKPVRQLSDYSESDSSVNVENVIASLVVIGASFLITISCFLKLGPIVLTNCSKLLFDNLVKFF